MGQHNARQDELCALQNRFTGYLLTAIRRTKRDYIKKQSQFSTHELLTDYQDTQYSDSHTCDAAEFEEAALKQALSQLTPREWYVFFERVLNGKGYDELAQSLHLSYNGAASIYHRAVTKLRRVLKEGET